MILKNALFSADFFSYQIIRTKALSEIKTKELEFLPLSLSPSLCLHTQRTKFNR